MLLVAVACLNTGRVSAGCGDYVTILKGPRNASHHPDSHGGRTAVPTYDESPVLAKPPCHGRNCSSSPAKDSSPLVPVVPVGPRAKELTQHLGSTCDSGADPGVGVKPSTISARPISLPPSIFHPPRFG